MCDFSGREITKYMVMYGASLQFWPTLLTCERAHTGSPRRSTHLTAGQKRRHREVMGVNEKGRFTNEVMDTNEKGVFHE
jgi:hypothetical protein